MFNINERLKYETDLKASKDKKQLFKTTLMNHIKINEERRNEEKKPVFHLYFTSFI